MCTSMLQQDLKSAKRTAREYKREAIPTFSSFSLCLAFGLLSFFLLATSKVPSSAQDLLFVSRCREGLRCICCQLNERCILVYERSGYSAATKKDSYLFFFFETITDSNRRAAGANRLLDFNSFSVLWLLVLIANRMSRSKAGFLMCVLFSLFSTIMHPVRPGYLFI